MVTENDPLGGHTRAFDTLEYHEPTAGDHESFKGGARVSYYDRHGATRNFRAIETSAPENIPLILGGVKNTYIGQSEVQPYLGAIQQGELVFIHREDLLLPIVIDKAQTKSFGSVTDAEWRGAGHSNLDSYINRLGGFGKNGEHAAVAETLSHAHATVLNFHVATANELLEKGLDPKVVADQVRQSRATLQANNPNAEDAATRFAVGTDEEAGHSFQAATGKAIADMRTPTHIDRETALLATGAKR